MGSDCLIPQQYTIDTLQQINGKELLQPRQLTLHN
jgi:hypothetical protein